MRVSKENEKYYLALIRRYLITVPDAGAAEIQRFLERNLHGRLSLGYIYKLKRKLTEQSVWNIEMLTRKKLASQLLDFSNELLAVLLNIVFGGTVGDRDRALGSRVAMEIKGEQIRLLLQLRVLDNNLATQNFQKRKAQEPATDITAEDVEGLVNMLGGWRNLEKKDVEFLQRAIANERAKEAGLPTHEPKKESIPILSDGREKDPWAFENFGFPGFPKRT